MKPSEDSALISPKPLSDAALKLNEHGAIAASASVHVLLNELSPSNAIKGLAADMTYEERLSGVIVDDTSRGHKHLTIALLPSLILPAPADHIPRRGGKLVNAADWVPLPAEDRKDYLRRLMTEGHTVPDAFMTMACAQVGQIMLNSPMSLYLMGLYSGAISMFFFLVFGYWTIYQFMALYLELKRCKVMDGSWYETEGKHERVIQIFDVFGFFLGRWAMIVAVVLAFIALVGVLMTQITACANKFTLSIPLETNRSGRSSMAAPWSLPCPSSHASTTFG